MSSGALPVLGDATRAVEVRHQGELLGALSVTKRRGESLTPIEEKLVDDLAHQAGLVIKNVGLSADLQVRLDELRASRQRLVQAQDLERRRLERNLHDGAQQHLVALKVKLGLAEMLLDRDPAKAMATLEQLKGDADEALETLRDLARGIYPPLLADKGLVVALESQARKATVPVRVHADGVERYSQDVEATVYFCVLEALQNVQKYARASHVDLRLHERGESLTFEVQDDGAGFDTVTAKKGAGLTNMSDRLDALGGTFAVSSTLGSGTTIRGSNHGVGSREGCRVMTVPAAAVTVRSRSSHAHPVVAWSLAVIALGLFITFGALYFSPVTSPALFRAGGGAISGFWLFPYASIVPVGLLIALRRPANPIGWLALGAALLLGLGSTAALVGSILFEAHSSLGGPVLLVSALWNAPGGGVITLLLVMVLLFPDGQLQSQRWRWVLYGLLAAGSAGVVVAVISPTPGGLGVTSSPTPGVVLPISILAIPGSAGVMDALSTVVRSRGRRSGRLRGHLDLPPHARRRCGWATSDQVGRFRGHDHVDDDPRSQHRPSREQRRAPAAVFRHRRSAADPCRRCGPRSHRRGGAQISPV